MRQEAAIWPSLLLAINACRKLVAYKTRRREHPETDRLVPAEHLPFHIWIWTLADHFQ